MAGVRLHDYTRDNLPIIRRLVRAGIISGRIIRHFRIYESYRKLPPGTNNMDRYETLAKEWNISTRTAMRAIKEMEQTI